MVPKDCTGRDSALAGGGEGAGGEEGGPGLSLGEPFTVPKLIVFAANLS